jgi:hypothetical protein
MGKGSGYVLLAAEGITHLLASRLVTLGLEGAQGRVTFARDHIADVFTETFLGIGLDSIVDLVREILLTTS